LDLKDGDEVRISSPHGSIYREVRLERGLKEGFIFIPIAFNENDAMGLIKLTGLGLTDAPGWKSCDVKIEKTEKGTSNERA
ncbi:molybdopterin dinucleotide binding domain-containing protein, partial [Thermodesulfobacteriota bacterium]